VRQRDAAGRRLCRTPGGCWRRRGRQGEGPAEVGGGGAFGGGGR
jgi:hypothetical protein